MNETFQMISKNAARLKEVRDDSDVSLKLEDFQEERMEEKTEAKKYDKIMENAIEGLVVKNLEVDLKTINADEGKTERNKKWIEGLEKDVYVQEALLIMKDMMK